MQRFRRIVRPNGPQLAAAIRQLWLDLNVEKTLEDWTADEAKSGAVHATVWRQLNAWLDDLALAFAAEPMSLPDWLPILEAALAELSVGVIPPALDQVLIGTIDRSRNPDLKLAILLGVNETVFPAAPPEGSLLNDADREELERHEVRLGPGRREFLGRERFLGYIACTRARQRLVLSCSERDTQDQPLNPSVFFAQLKCLFTNLQVERFIGADGTRPEHLCELPVPREQIADAPDSAEAGRLPTPLAEQLYGPALRTSVSRLEEFAACAFKFFAHSGLRAEERKRFELGVRERGSFQHEVLRLFHEGLRDDNKNWRDITPAEARLRVKDCVEQLLPQFNGGLLAATARSRFTARVVGESLQDFVAATVEWMAHYKFDPHQSELGFGIDDGELPAWELALGAGHRLIIRGKIDRVDLCRNDAGDDALAVVIDYKSGARKLENILVANGVQLQLAAYLGVLRHLADTRSLFGVGRLAPAGVFYVNLRGKSQTKARTRQDVLETSKQSRLKRYQHLGRFDGAALSYFDNSGALAGTQFNFRLKIDGTPFANNTDLLSSDDFRMLLDHVESELVRMGREIYDGLIEVNPFQHGIKTACDNCDCKSICRFDPWTQPYRILKAVSPAGSGD